MNKRIANTNAPARQTYDLLSGASGSVPEAIAASDENERVSYRELSSRVDRYARALLGQGLKRGDRLAMLAAPSIDFWVVFHAATSIGVTWLGINPRYQSRDFEHVLSDADPALLVVMSPFDGRDYCEELKSLAGNTPMVCHGTASAGAVPQDLFLALGARVSDADLSAARLAVDPEDIALIVYTSGTTGKPKGAMLSHRAIVSSALTNCDWMGRENLRSSICAAPVNHVGAINNLCMPVLAAAGHLIFHPRVDIAAIGEISRREHPTYLVSSPTGFAMMLQHPNGMAQRLTDTRLIVFGGAVTAESTLEQFARPGLHLSNVYGQTETCGIITRTVANASLADMSETIGEVLPGAELRVVDPLTGKSTPVGTLGEIQVRGPYIMSGYFRNPDATAAAFTHDDFLHTGDLGMLRPDGNVVFSGRLKEMFKSGGYNVYPVEVEQAICEYPGIALAAVIAVPHPSFQEVGHAYVELAPEFQVTEDELRRFLRERIANYKIPKTFSIEHELPKLPNGKIDKLTLKIRALG